MPKKDKKEKKKKRLKRYIWEFTYKVRLHKVKEVYPPNNDKDAKDVAMEMIPLVPGPCYEICGNEENKGRTALDIVHDAAMAYDFDIKGMCDSMIDKSLSEKAAVEKVRDYFDGVSYIFNQEIPRSEVGYTDA